MKLTVETRELVKALRACRLAASKDRTRPHLASVWIRALGPGMAHLFATDGHWLAVARLLNPEVTATGDASIPTEDIASVLAVAPRKPLGGHRTTIERTGVMVAMNFGGSGAITVRGYDVQPVPAHTIVSRDKSPKKHGRPTLSTVLLARVCAAVDEMATSSKRGKSGLRILATEESEVAPQIVWSPHAREFFAVLMPMRVDGKRDMKWWGEHADALVALEPKPEAVTSAAAE